MSSPKPKKKRRRPYTRRHRDLVAIHVAKRQLALEESTYRAMLHSVAGVDSAADLDQEGRNKVLAHLRERGATIRRASAAPPPEKRRLLWKIYQLLGDRPTKYAAAILKNQGGPDALEWASPTQLRKVVAALQYDRKRREKRAADQRGEIRLDLLIDGALTLILGVLAFVAWTLIVLVLGE